MAALQVDQDIDNAWYPAHHSTKGRLAIMHLGLPSNPPTALSAIWAAAFFVTSRQAAGVGAARRATAGRTVALLPHRRRDRPRRRRGLTVEGLEITAVRL
eukprot:scaffold57074_cov61-Phaeocystis_antarctica.AAC.2